MSIDVFLSFFTLMLIALGMNLLSVRMRIPYTVLLVIVGSLLVPLAKIKPLDFITEFQLTPELLFFVFLPILIFESAYNMKFRNVIENKVSISVLAIFGVLISTIFVGFVGQWAFGLIGFDIPLWVILLFGAIISSTDPVAVLALFKEYGAPQRLTLIFEGESLFNDGTAFALFLVCLDITVHGYNGFTTIMSGLFAFSTMIVGGLVFGLIMGILFSTLIQWIKGNEHLEITLTLLVAHLTFLMTELISANFFIGGYQIRLSSIIATLVASMVIGNYGRFKMSVAVEEYMDKFWSYFAFLANSLVFILMGLLFASLSIELNIAILPILVTIFVVATGRAVSVYSTIGLINKFNWEKDIPMSWQHLLSWGSLRGSLAVIMTLLVPADLTLPDWHYDFSIREFIIAITIGCIYFTLLVKATTIAYILGKLKIDALSPQEQAGYFKSKTVVCTEIAKKIDELYRYQHINKEQRDHLTAHYQHLSAQAHEQGNQKNAVHFTENILRLYALGIEKAELKEIFRRGEINERIYKRILNILDIQVERVKKDEPQLHSENEHFSNSHHPRVVEWLTDKLWFWNKFSDTDQLYLYYRTQYKLVAATLHELVNLHTSPLAVLFDEEQTRKNVITEYEGLRNEINLHIQREINANQAFFDRLNEQSAKSILLMVEEQTLEQLYKNEIISTKLYISLKNELQE